jgi:TadE-like protein
VNGQPSHRGQTLVETALVLPLFLMVVMGTIVIGVGVFYQHQLSNAAREAARTAVISSASAQCPAVGHLLAVPTALTPDQLEQIGGSPFACDGPANNWPKLHAAARQAVFGLERSGVHLSACWSGYVDSAGNYDAPAQDPITLADNAYLECTLRRADNTAVDPRVATADLPCPPRPTVDSATTPPGTDGDDKASNLAISTSNIANRVTVYTCYVWRPPMAGFLLIPSEITLRYVVTEALHHQR